MTITREDRPSGQISEEWRTPAERDLDRILYASAYRRLAGVTQVLPAGEQPLMHNRLTHTLKVQQVARRAAQWLEANSSAEALESAGGLDPAVAEAAAAAHDLGHPPFGHVAEDEIQKILEKDGRLVDSFEGNAQSFRIVTKLSIRKQHSEKSDEADGHGLDLSFQTQAAILKYPWCRGEHAHRGTEGTHDEYYRRKWSAYESERSQLEKALEIVPVSRIRSLEAEIMDFADDITYAVHDIEDFFRLGLIPLHEIALGARRQSSARVFDDFWDFATAEIQAKGEVEFDAQTARTRLELVADLLPDKPYQDSSGDRLSLHRFISQAVSAIQRGTLVNARGEFTIPRENRMLIEVLKQLTWYFVIEHPALAALQQGQRRIIRDLVGWLESWVTENDAIPGMDTAKRRKLERRRVRELPARLISYVNIGRIDAEKNQEARTDEQIRLRAIIDYITSLTEAETIAMYRRLGGTETSGLFPIALTR